MKNAPMLDTGSRSTAPAPASTQRQPSPLAARRRFSRLMPLIASIGIMAFASSASAQSYFSPPTSKPPKPKIEQVQQKDMAKPKTEQTPPMVSKLKVLQPPALTTPELVPVQQTDTVKTPVATSNSPVSYSPRVPSLSDYLPSPPSDAPAPRPHELRAVVSEFDHPPTCPPLGNHQTPKDTAQLMPLHAKVAAPPAPSQASPVSVTPNRMFPYVELEISAQRSDGMHVTDVVPWKVPARASFIQITAFSVTPSADGSAERHPMPFVMKNKSQATKSARICWDGRRLYTSQDLSIGSQYEMVSRELRDSIHIDGTNQRIALHASAGGDTLKVSLMGPDNKPSGTSFSFVYRPIEGSSFGRYEPCGHQLAPHLRELTEVGLLPAPSNTSDSKRSGSETLVVCLPLQKPDSILQ